MINKESFIYWFRNDLRLLDQPALIKRLETAKACLFVYLITPAQVACTTVDNVMLPFHRLSPLRQQYRHDALQALERHLRSLGSQLLVLQGSPTVLLAQLSQAMDDADIVCEEIAAPEEQQEIAALRASGLQVFTHWGASLFAVEDLPWTPERLPPVFTHFRQTIEQQAVRPLPCTPAPTQLPKLATGAWLPAHEQPTIDIPSDQQSSPYLQPDWQGGTLSGQRHLARYFRSDFPSSYKATRNQLLGMHFSTRFSPWLANGALSPRQVYAALQQYEAQYGANESTYWIWFELLWREYFRYLHVKEGKRLYRYHGLAQFATPPAIDAPMLARFEQWRQGETGHTFIDAGMNELRTTGWLSNRMRQNVASYWIHDLQGDWRLGAAWFEHCLVDFDIYSNQGNWLYIAGKGTDPRGGRRFNPDKQAKDYDPEGEYRRTWSLAT